MFLLALSCLVCRRLADDWPKYVMQSSITKTDFLMLPDPSCRRRLYVDNSHTGAVRGVRSLDNCSWIASGGSDCTVRIWCVPEGDGDGQVAPHEQWQDARSAAVQAGLYGQRDVLPARGPGQLSFNARQEVRCIAGFSVNAIYAGDSSGRIYALSLEPGLEPF